MKTGLQVERFDYVRHNEQLAVVRLVAGLGADHQAPDPAALSLAFGRYTTSSPARDCRIERVSRRRFGRRALQWSASFSVALEIVEHPKALFELTAPGCATVPLPGPDLRTPTACGLDGVRRGRLPAGTARGRLAVAATAFAFTTGPTAAMAVGATTAPNTPSSATSAVSGGAGAAQAPLLAPVTPATQTSTTTTTTQTSTTTTTPTTVPPPATTLPPATTATTTTTVPPATTTVPPQTTTVPTTTVPTTTVPRLTKPPPAKPQLAKPRAGKPQPPKSVPSTAPTPPIARPSLQPPTHTPNGAQAIPVPAARAKRGGPPLATVRWHSATKPSTGGVSVQQPDATASTPAPEDETTATPTSAPSFGITQTGVPGQLASPFANASQPPAFLIPIYRAAGRRYHVPWRILAAINSVETDFGRNLNVSSAGAVGWMQFMPATWAQYAVDARKTGRPDPNNPRDAIFTAARYLAANGARHDLRTAIFAYNHANWYVDEVLAKARQIILPPAGAHATLLPDGTAVAPRNAPRAVKRAIAAANQISTKPYPSPDVHYGSLATPWPAYDCSGSVSYVLYKAGLHSATPDVSGTLESWGGAGPGRWITVYATSGHTWIVIAGLAFDTADFGGPNVPAGSGPRWRSNPTGNLADGMTYVVRHPAGL
jgi:soluble lytic murein transglycosylase-like protein